jgi:hypothetical protein
MTWKLRSGLPPETARVVVRVVVDHDDRFGGLAAMHDFKAYVAVSVPARAADRPTTTGGVVSLAGPPLQARGRYPQWRSGPLRPP